MLIHSTVVRKVIGIQSQHSGEECLISAHSQHSGKECLIRTGAQSQHSGHECLISAYSQHSGEGECDRCSFTARL